MEDDIVDFEDFDYGDLGDVNPDDLDIENLERELGLLKEESESTEPKAENDKKPPTLKPDESTAPSKQEEKPKIADKPSIKPSYTSAPPKRAPFVPHSAASFPQYPFVQQGMMGMKYVFHPIVNISFFPFGSPVPLQSFPVPSLHPYIPIHPYIQLSCFKILEQKTPYFLPFFKIVFREKKICQKKRKKFTEKKRKEWILQRKKKAEQNKKNTYTKKRQKKKFKEKRTKRAFFGRHNMIEL